MIKFCYKEYELGTLCFDYNTQEYIYNSNIEEEKKAKEKYLGLEFYYLSNSVNKRSKDLFVNFLEFLPALSREDIVKMVEIKKEDSQFEKLEKLSKIDIISENFYIKKA